MDIWALKCNLQMLLPSPILLSFGEQSWRETRDEWGKPVTTQTAHGSSLPATIFTCYSIEMAHCSHDPNAVLTPPRIQPNPDCICCACTCSVWSLWILTHPLRFLWFKATHQLLNSVTSKVFSWPRSQGRWPSMKTIFQGLELFSLSLCWGLESV